MTAFLLRRLTYLLLLVIVSTSVAYLLAATELRIEALQPPRPDDADFQEGPLGELLAKAHS